MSSAERTDLLRVAFPSARNTQQTEVSTQSGATSDATQAQHTSLKTLALLALTRNTPRNNHATHPTEGAQQTPVREDGFVAQEFVACVALPMGRNDATTDSEVAACDHIRLQLLRLASAELIDVRLVNDLAYDDLLECVALGESVLRAYLYGLRDSARRERGQIPAGETARGMCRRCGPIWIGPEVAACAPIADGWPQVLGCPWCHVRNRQAIPRPEVTCGECRHFVRDRINPDGGLGRCGAGLDPEVPYPHARRQCKSWRSA